jgi:hypothetical protein
MAISKAIELSLLRQERSGIESGFESPDGVDLSSYTHRTSAAAAAGLGCGGGGGGVFAAGDVFFSEQRSFPGVAGADEDAELAAALAASLKEAEGVEAGLYSCCVHLSHSA